LRRPNGTWRPRPLLYRPQPAIRRRLDWVWRLSGPVDAPLLRAGRWLVGCGTLVGRLWDAYGTLVTTS
jgi:hypothetical protein